jgi:fibronectin type 3 domain-containing protein
MLQPTYSVSLTWLGPASSADPVASYDVYRAVSGGTWTLLVNQKGLSYTDSTVVDGATYQYQVTSVDASGVQSVPSNVFAAAIP